MIILVLSNASLLNHIHIHTFTHSQLISKHALLFRTIMIISIKEVADQNFG